MSIDSPALSGPLLIELAERARAELAAVRADLDSLEPAMWHSPTARRLADIIRDLRADLLTAEAAIDDGERMIRSLQ
ncbi:hypothetical protein [Naasia lichenicola]|uniref:Uncharacterized protein n=1 Tax=Naasia lichenicola TaxID=2565933 RepID=A0A4S4FJQ1_9MICO|nr:hypothetical protein [Naasia lichenicola]THG29485.1 hypothetical protein E6C64_12365 [Naasia lichenicola]